MGKKLGGVSWRAVALEGIPMDAAALDGFVGLEECTDYDLDKNAGPKRKRKEPKNSSSNKQSCGIPNNIKTQDGPSLKKQKLSNGFVVETVKKIKPSTVNDKLDNHSKDKTQSENTKNKKKQSRKKGASKKLSNNSIEKDETKIEEKVEVKEMHAWSQFQVPEEILRALAEQGFDKPTKIQELCLPAAMLGRRDILGAAETGSGKTLAFAIPILAGIMKLKEQQLNGQDYYDLQYKKSSIKKDKIPNENTERKLRKPLKKSTKDINGEDLNTSNESKENNSDGSDQETDDEGIERDGELSDDDVMGNDKTKENQDSDSDNSSGYVHLSEMFDSDDLDDSSDEENDPIVDAADDDTGNDESSDEESQCGEEEEVDAEQIGDGVGCVKVIDDVEMPARPAVKTARPLYGLVVTPTRELAMQISKHMIAAAKYTGIRVAVLVGGMAQVKQERVLAAGPELVVCTPGRLWELLQQNNPHLQQIDDIKFLAIDETDRMLERNHFEELAPLLERLNADPRRRAGRQNFVMSATLTVTHELPSHLRGKKVTKRGKIINRKVQKMTPQQKIKRLVAALGMSDPKVVDLTADNHGTAESLTECRITCALEQKDSHLFYVLRTHPGRTIVFCNSIGCVKRLAQLFTLLKCHPLPLHAEMPQRQRLKNLEKFRDSPHGVLVATDVAARGLDIPDVDHVIHYQVPRTAENYVHRSGRTARAKKEGLTILMIEPGEALLYAKMCRTLNKTAELPEFPVPPSALAALKACVELARETERAALAVRRRARETGWLERAARDCDILVDGDFVPMQKKLEESGDAAAIAKSVQIKKKQLDAMLTRPLFPRGFSYKYPTLNNASSLVVQSEENALQAMKRVLETGAHKKEKRKSKNAPLLNLERNFRPNGEAKAAKSEAKVSQMGGKVEKKKKKKFYKRS